MTGKQIKQKIFSSSISGYILLFTKIITGLIITKLLFQNITNLEYGFWALLWSFFGYIILFDMGQGVTIQKVTAQYLVNKERVKYNQFISTTLCNYLFISLAILVATFLLSANVKSFIEPQAYHLIEQYKSVVKLLGIGTALYFPLGIFAEILTGSHRVSFKNIIQLIFKASNFGVIVWMHLNGTLNLYHLTLVTVVLAIVENLVIFGATIYFMRETFKIFRPVYRFKVFKEYMSFSITAYIATICTLVIYRTDIVVISTFSLTSFVAIYHVSSRFSDTLRQFSSQFVSMLGPLTATIAANSNPEEKLNRLLSFTVRYSGLINILPTFLLMAYSREILQVWLGFSDPDGIIVCQILLFSCFLHSFYRLPFERVLLMNGGSYKLSKILMFESIANFLLSVTLLKLYGIIGVALGTLIPNVLIVLCYTLPGVLKKYDSNKFRFLLELFMQPLMLGGMLWTAKNIIPKAVVFPENLINILIHFTLLSILYLFLSFLMLRAREKNKIINFVKSKARLIVSC